MRQSKYNPNSPNPCMVTISLAGEWNYMSYNDFEVEPRCIIIKQYTSRGEKTNSKDTAFWSEQPMAMLWGFNSSHGHFDLWVGDRLMCRSEAYLRNSEKISENGCFHSTLPFELENEFRLNQPRLSDHLPQHGEDRITGRIGRLVQLDREVSRVNCSNYPDKPNWVIKAGCTCVACRNERIE